MPIRDLIDVGCEQCCHQGVCIYQADYGTAVKKLEEAFEDFKTLPFILRKPKCSFYQLKTSPIPYIRNSD